LRKKHFALYAVLAAGAALVAVGFAVNVVVGGILAAVYAFFGIWWIIYFRKLTYVYDKDVITITKGIFIRKIYCLPLKNVLWSTKIRLKFPFLPIDKYATIIEIFYTAGGKVVIFADFSTDS
jgi:hypothetical protein